MGKPWTKKRLMKLFMLKYIKSKGKDNDKNNSDICTDTSSDS